MSETKFTPAPWCWVHYKDVDGFYGLYSGDQPIVYPQRCNDGDDGNAWFSTDESYYGETALTEADAHLIAAAPEMYDFIKKVFDIQKNHYGYAMELHMAMIKLAEESELLLAKARGEQ